MNRKIYKLIYRLGLLKPYKRIDRLHYLNRLKRGKKNSQDEWAYVENDFSQYDSNDLLICSPFRGMRIFFCCNPLSRLERKIIRDGLYNSAILEFMEILSVPNCIVLDIGANIGAYTIPLAKAHPEIEVHAYEPNPSALERFQKNMNINGVKNVVLKEVGAGGLTGELELNAFDKRDLAFSSFLPPLKKGSRKILVKVVRLDDVYQESIKPVCLIKIDTQGYECQILEGAQALIRRYHPPILLEHEDDLFHQKKDSETTKKNLKALFVDLGYEVFYMTKKDPFMLFPVRWDRFLSGDLLALDKGRFMASSLLKSA
jgi:FkbM family methyltransferase